MRVRPVGERAFLLETATLDDVLALHAGLEVSRPDGVIDLVPAARTVLVRVDPRAIPLSAARTWAERTAAAAEHHAAGNGSTVEVEVAYDGDDLADTAALLGLTADELVRRHTDAAWTVAFTGFAPGFGYLVSDDWPYDVPRLATPRTRVPAGAVGLAAGFAGAYPRETPGGWRLIGRTAAPLFDPDAASPALLAPGMRVQFRAVPDIPLAASRTASPPGSVTRGLVVTEPGLLATLQDAGRSGAASMGVAGSGALDRAALRTAHRLLGNPEDATGIEITMGGFRAVARRDLWFAVTGAWGPVRLDGREVDPYEAHEWPSGAELHVDWFAHGARAYLAVRGGLEGPTVLGSRSTDVMAGLGPEPLRAGTEVGVADAASAPIPPSLFAPWGAPHDDELEIELAPGPREDWFTPEALTTLYESVWTVSNHADRVGARLDGPELVRVRTGELPSEGMVAGALQVPPSGRPTILLADGPVTGGYPVIAVVTDASLDLVAQARPGTRIRFRHARRTG
ncbi:urea amidolyase family protein [Microbacterium sp. CFH 31415]|uniref:5-oxoprolinase subunit B/C family protein n=1 Tax=Microbacterium sp. CFH 31415 TaxID=2921732 RepID=UPI001F148D47|nr:5-oxoprolinase/urea amidolyase family protein [Microbacterium sp. CFH 31415]MCH6232021.1 urea amidolyase family protein [Microbacterium sp. CFH 31415]